MIDSRVRAGWAAFSACFEGRCAWPYLDIRGLPTVGLGCLLSEAAFLAQPWTGGDASAGWTALKGAPAGLLFTHYASVTPLRLSEEAIDDLARQRLDADAEQLAKTFPAFSSWPWQAQAAALSMAWAMGAGFPSSWPRWAASARAEDWRGCAANCEIRWTDNMGVRGRDLAQQALFLAAADALPEGGPAALNWPSGPTRDVALKALAVLGIGI
jgi:GH24 family phage-related lysozyme (muramidase)